MPVVHHGVVRVAICFLTKFGMMYFFVTTIASFVSIYVLMSYFTQALNNITEQVTTGSKPIPPSDTLSSKLLSYSGAHLKLASNLKHLQNSLSNSAEDTVRYSLDLVEQLREYSFLPTCSQENLLNILITSSPRNFKQREAIRKTWCSNDMKSMTIEGNHTDSGNIQCFFLLGRSLSVNIQNSVQIEAKRYNDILDGTYLDSYRNLTLKVLQGFIWDSQFCKAKYVLKTDDDCFVNVPVMRSLLVQKPDQRDVYVGYVMDEPKKRTVIRDSFSKWEVSQNLYRPSYYPPYISGSGYLLSQDVVQLIATLHTTITLIPVEDAYVGILLNSFGITPIHSNRFSVHPLKWQLCNLLYFVVMHQTDIATQTTLLQDSIRSYTMCRERYRPEFSWN